MSLTKADLERLERIEGMLADLIDKVGSIARVQDDLVEKVTSIGIDVVAALDDEWDDPLEG